ncbi:MAG: hypothetical protein DRJ37_06350 [Thermoprotei archaeon]|nr:MAG: hypothetical protein DRJ37_06350 [Thermoprotei archaeon]
MAALGKDKIVKDFYPVDPKFGAVTIVEDRQTGRLLYLIVEPPLSEDEEKKLKEIKNLLIETIDVELVDMDKGKIREYLEKRVEEIIKKYKIKVAKEAVDKLKYYIVRDILGYGKIDVPMKDRNIEDISCDGVRVPVYVWHRSYESIPTNIVFDDEEELRAFITKLAYKARRQISIANPIVDGILPEGYRVHLTLGEVSRRGGTFTIRKFKEEPFTIVDLVILKSMNPLMAAYFWILLEYGKSLMILGSTAAGKTTTLNAVAMLIRPEAKIITIEETPELRLPHENWVPLVTRPSRSAVAENVTLFDLLKASLRMRPDYIIVGEIRGEEAYTLFQAIATGHAGLSTMHAENVDYAIKRLTIHPMNIPKPLVPVMNVFAHIARVKIGDRIERRIVNVYEIEGYDGERDEIIMNKVFEWDSIRDDYIFAGTSKILEKIAEDRFVPLSFLNSELKRRERLISLMVHRNQRSFQQVSKVVRSYYFNPETTYRLVEAGAL